MEGLPDEMDTIWLSVCSVSGASVVALAMDESVVSSADAMDESSGAKVLTALSDETIVTSSVTLSLGSSVPDSLDMVGAEEMLPASVELPDPSVSDSKVDADDEEIIASVAVTRSLSSG